MSDVSNKPPQKPLPQLPQLQPQAPSPAAAVQPQIVQPSTKTVQYKKKDGTIKTYVYEEIKGVKVREYQNTYSKTHYEPTVRIHKYKKLPDDVKKLAFRLRHFAIGCGRIAKIINTDPNFKGVYVGEGTIEKLLADENEIKKFEYVPDK